MGDNVKSDVCKGELRGLGAWLPGWRDGPHPGPQ